MSTATGSYVQVTHGVLQPGGKYRVSMSIRAPYTDENIQGLEAKWRQLAGVAPDVVVDAFTVHFPNRSTGVWVATSDFHVPGSASTVGPSFGTAISGIGEMCQAAVRAIIGDVALLLTTVEQFVATLVTDVTNAAANTVNKTVLNPGVLILAVVGLFLIVTIRRG